MPIALKAIVNKMRTLSGRFQSDNDHELIQAVCKGERAAYDQLVIRYSDLAYGLAHRMLQQPELAEDIVQDCFIKVWQQADQWNPEQGKFSTWLYRIVSNRCLDELRSAVHRYNEPFPEDSELEAPLDTDSVFSNKEQQRQFYHALSQLKLDQRTAIALVYHSGLSNKEAAEVMGLQLKAFESLLVRAKSCLQQQVVH